MKILKAEIKEGSRATGRTFRKLLRALADASEGADVLYWVSNYSMVKGTYKDARYICEGYGLNSEDDSRKFEIDFPSGGSLTVTYASKREVEIIRMKHRVKLVEDLYHE